MRESYTGQLVRKYEKWFWKQFGQYSSDIAAQSQSQRLKAVMEQGNIWVMDVHPAIFQWITSIHY